MDCFDEVRIILINQEDSNKRLGNHCEEGKAVLSPVGLSSLPSGLGERKQCFLSIHASALDDLCYSITLIKRDTPAPVTDDETVGTLWPPCKTPDSTFLVSPSLDDCLQHVWLLLCFLNNLASSEATLIFASRPLLRL